MGRYFTINRARQYGKTTTLTALADYLSEAYIVLSLDFQMIGSEDFENAHFFRRHSFPFFSGSCKVSAILYMG